MRFASEATLQHIPFVESQVSEPRLQGTKPTGRLSETASLGGRLPTMVTAVPLRAPRHRNATALTSSNAHTKRGQLASLMIIVQGDTVTRMTHSLCVKRIYSLTADAPCVSSLLRHLSSPYDSAHVDR